MTIAQLITKKCGGPRIVADWLQIDRSTVQRWIGDGRVPAKRWASLIIAAKMNGVEVSIDDLIPAAAREAASTQKRRKAA